MNTNDKKVVLEFSFDDAREITDLITAATLGAVIKVLVTEDEETEKACKETIGKLPRIGAYIVKQMKADFEVEKEGANS